MLIQLVNMKIQLLEMNRMTAEKLEYTCIEKDQLSEQSAKIAELEARADFKDQRINELIEDNRRIESKIDKLTETVNNIVINSIKDDKDLKEDITKLKAKVEAQEKNFENFEKKQKEQRDDDRAKTNQYLTAIGIGLGVLYFVLNFVFK